jgi:hypothetical protein
MPETSKIYLIIAPNAESGALETLPKTENMVILTSEALVKTGLRFSKNDKTCLTSEASIEILLEKTDDLARKNAMTVLKNKHQFREILREIYPDFDYYQLKLTEIEQLNVTQKSVIKPLKGCFGTAVRVIDRDSDMKKIALELAAELAKNGAVFSENVLSKEDFLVEKFVGGEEYAVDMFFNDVGEPCIVQIYHHPMPENLAYLHMIYYASKEVFEHIYQKARDFFQKLNRILDVTNMAMHAEFKLEREILFPIEINSMRFGGMGLGNMAFHGFGVNPYQCFLENREPNWTAIWQQNPTELFAYFIAYNGVKKNKATHQPNREKLQQQFSEILLAQNFDFQTQLAFGVYVLKETKKSLPNLLAIDFDAYFEAI